MPDPLSDLQRLGQEFDADVVEAVARAIRKSATGTDEIGLYPLEKWRDQARAAIAAALRAQASALREPREAG